MKTNTSNSAAENTPLASLGTPPNTAIWDRVERVIQNWLKLNLPKYFQSWLRSPDGGRSVVHETLSSETSASLQVFLTKLDKRIGEAEVRIEARHSAFLPQLASEIEKAVDRFVEVRTGRRRLLWAVLVTIAVPVFAATFLKLKEGYLTKAGRDRVQSLELRIGQLSATSARQEKQLQLSRVDSMHTSDRRVWVKGRPGSQPMWRLSPEGEETVWFEVQVNE